MKYIAILYGNPEFWDSIPPEQRAKGIAAVDAYNERYTASGELLGAYGLGDALTAKTVTIRNGVPAVTDGPYIEAREFVSSFYMLDVESEERALQIVSEYPFSPNLQLEVWPILHQSAGAM